MAFLRLKGKANFEKHYGKMKLTLLKKCEMLFKFFLLACDVYSHFEFELKK